MQFMNEDIFNVQEKIHGSWMVVPINLQVKVNGSAVMGAGLAKQAADRWKSLPKELGQELISQDLQTFTIFTFPEIRVVAAPTKVHWRNKSSLELVEKSCMHIRAHFRNNLLVVLPKMGCGLGQLKWEDVEPLYERYFKTDNYIVVDNEGSK